MQQELVYHKCQDLHGLRHGSQQCAWAAAEPYHDLGWFGKVVGTELRELIFFASLQNLRDHTWSAVSDVREEKVNVRDFIFVQSLL